MSTPGTLPPGPPLPAFVQTAMMLRHWSRFVSACRRRYGDVFTLRIASMGTWVYLADPADIKTVFAGDPTVFHAGEANSMLSGLLGETSVLVIDEDVHRDRRRLMLAPFARDAVARQTGVMAEVAATNIASWPVGTPFPVAPKMAEIALEVILRTVIGATEPARLAALRHVMPQLLGIGPWQSLAIASPGLQRRRPWRTLQRNLAEADRLLYAEIAACRAGPDLASRPDALAMLVRAANDEGRTMTDRELRDQLMTLLVAGHETTATGLSWTLERLIRHPAVLDKAVAAARTTDGSGEAYLDAVVRESLRIRPVVFEAGRVLTEPVELGGYLLPAGTLVAPSIGLVHASADVYPDPDRFEPDRMLASTQAPSTWLPFGGGNRRCLGATFALVEMRVVLREILHRVDLFATTARGEKQRLKHVTMIPHRGGRICVRALRDVAPAPMTCPAEARRA
ncbi:cytochrome P450 [Mycolicibacterium smegmatis]|uniref:Cytochrome P450 120 n=1 Tax=Mycolicibacterium smegmatis TaxID=1772 RepID=A0A653FGI2_MYCSM|nr:cytochrome P450 [Mycolicibacterium smegmatis]VTP08747.1 Putative cytochrome P450 120 [Mycolicibacterium smegmatis]